MVGHMCRKYGRKPNLEKVNAISKIKAYNSIIVVRRFLDTCIFYHIWMPYFANISEPLYKLLKKDKKIIWKKDHQEAMENLKILTSPLIFI